MNENEHSPQTAQNGLKLVEKSLYIDPRTTQTKFMNHCMSRTDGGSNFDFLEPFWGH